MCLLIIHYENTVKKGIFCFDNGILGGQYFYGTKIQCPAGLWCRNSKGV